MRFEILVGRFILVRMKERSVCCWLGGIGMEIGMFGNWREIGTVAGPSKVLGLKSNGYGGVSFSQGSRDCCGCGSGCGGS